MSAKPSHRDDILFISALAALLVGLGLLLRTTGVTHGYRSLWPIIVMAAGGVLCWFASLRRSRPAILAGGLFFILVGCIALIAGIFRWRFVALWPLLMTSAGLAWLIAGLRFFRRMKLSFVVPSMTFIFLGLFFCLFSFKIVGVSFGRFIVSWWPSFLIAGGVVLFIAWGVSRRAYGVDSPEGKPPARP